MRKTFEERVLDEIFQACEACPKVMCCVEMGCPVYRIENMFTHEHDSADCANGKEVSYSTKLADLLGTGAMQTRTLMALKRNGLMSVGDMSLLSESELRSLKGIGKCSADDAVSFMRRNRLAFKDE